jgi:hypothetical protein
MKRPPSTLTDMPARAQFLEFAEVMMEYRPQVAAIATSLRTSEEPQEDPTDDRSELGSVLECAFVDSFDLLLRGLLAAAGGPHAKLMEGALDVARLIFELEQMCEGLPHSPQEDAMLDGEVEPDEPTEIRTTVQAMIVDQLQPALDNLLYAARYRQSGSPSKGNKK